MTPDDARSWIAERYSAEAMTRLTIFRDMLLSENDRQNLIAASTVSTIWSRHLLDSAQLVDHAPQRWRHWVDIGSGAGLPGIVVAILTGRRVTLVEPRRLRVEFLHRCCSQLDLSDVTILQVKAVSADVVGAVDVISARAVASLDVIFSTSARYASQSTTYILPKGASAKSEVAAARRSWQGMFHVEQSIVDPNSGIVVATGVARR